jgi:[ribosomal protein S18]-alanine N-acetyltransferase
MTTTVRVASLADASAIAAIFARVNPHEGDHAAHEGRVRQDIARPIARVTAAEDNAGDLVGALVAWHVVDEVTVVDVAVSPTRRREGHGRALVEELLVWSRAHEKRLVLLEVRASNTPARTLYAALGFTDVNVRRGYYADGEDAVEMHATLALLQASAH